MPIRVNTHFLVALTGFVLFVVFWFAQDENWRRPSAAWPETILYGIAILSAILVIQGVILKHRESVFAEGSKKRMVIACVALLAWSLLIYGLGFVVGSVLAFTVMAFYVAKVEKAISPKAAMNMTRGNVVLWLVVILVQVLVLYYVFSEVLLVPLPEGLFF
ncbi:tripartite tricarboxylate transporter TctB family protein [Halomonas organivorans]